MIKNGQGLSEFIDLTIGVLQGEVLSPILFALFIADLEDFLKSRGITGIELAGILRIILLAYADDIVFTALSIEEMNRILDLLKEYCESNDLTVNTEKTNLVIFKKGGRNFKNLQFRFGNSEIKIVKNYTYLGVTFDSRGLFNLAAKEIYAKANVAVKATISTIHKANISSLKTIDKMFSSLISSIAEYASQIWAVQHLDILERIQTNFFKKLMWLPINTPAYAVRVEFGKTRLSAKVFKLCLNYIQKVKMMTEDRYPRAMLAELMLLREGARIAKYSWLDIIENNFIKEIEHHENIDYLAPDFDKVDNLLLVNKLRNKYNMDDIAKAKESKSLIVFPFLNLELGDSAKMYQNVNAKLICKKTIAQFRLLNRFNSRIVIFDKCYKIRKDLNCQSCNKKDVNFLHWIFDCNDMIELRSQCKVGFLNEIEIDKLSLLLEAWCGISPSEICDFVKKVLENLETNMED